MKTAKTVLNNILSLITFKWLRIPKIKDHSFEISEHGFYTD